MYLSKIAEKKLHTNVALIKSFIIEGKDKTIS